MHAKSLKAAAAMASSCIYRIPKHAGACCQEACTHSTRFCASHRRYSNQPIFRSIAQLMGTEAKIDHSNIYTCLAGFFDARGARKGGLAAIDLAFEAADMLGYLLSHAHIHNIAQRLQIPCETRKQRTVMSIVASMWRVWCFAQRPAAIAALAHLQNRWRAGQNTPAMGPWPGHPAVNHVDPFTLEDLQDLPKGNVFSLREQHKIYAFDMKPLYEHVFVQGVRNNPYTREPLRPSDIQRLERCMRLRFGTQPPPTKNVLVKRWDTPGQAATEMTIEIEQLFGVFLQPQWFMHLQYTEVVSIFDQFHRLSRELGDHYFIVNTETGHQPLISLVRECLFLATHDMNIQKTFLVCCALAAMAAQVPAVDAALPDWVLDAAGM